MSARTRLLRDSNPDATLAEIDPQRPHHVPLGAGDPDARALGRGFADGPGEVAGAPLVGADAVAAGLGADVLVGAGDTGSDGVGVGSGIVGSVGTSDTTRTVSRKSYVVIVVTQPGQTSTVASP